MTTISLDLKAFAAAVAAVAPILDSAVKVPAYQHLRVDLESGRMTLAASSLDMEARAAFAAEGPDASFLLPRPVADFLSARAGQAPAEAHVTVSDGAREIVAVHGRARIVQPGLPSDLFDMFSAVNATLRFTLRAGELSALLKPVLRAIAESDPTRPALEGALLHPHGDELRAVGADGNRLHVCAVSAPAYEGEWPQTPSIPGLIVPRRAVERLIALVEGLENEVSIAAAAGFLSVAVGDVMLFTRLISAAPLDYVRILPVKGGTTVVIDGGDLGRAIKALAVVPASKAKAGSAVARTVCIELGRGGVGLTMKGDNGAAEDFIAADVEAGEGVAVAFGGRYIEDAIAAVGGGRVRMTAPNGAAGAAWTIDADGRDAAFALVAPRIW